jgi:excisionase family DNA binding protein
MPEDFLTVEEAAKRLKVTPYTMREYLKAKKVRGVKVSRQWRVPESALTELANGQAPGATE